MSTFREARAKLSVLPEDHVVITPTSWASEWPEKSAVDVAIGIRRLSDADLQTARAEAAKFALAMHDDREGQVEAFNDALMRWAIVGGTCDANDVRLPAPIFGGLEENVRLALTSNAIRYVWDRVERFHLATSPIVTEASDEDLARLGAMLPARPHWEKLSVGQQKRFRKLARFLLEELLAVDPEHDPETEVEDALAVEDDGAVEVSVDVEV